MSESNGEPETGITDEQLPDDLLPSEDNPLAAGLDDGETVDDLMDGGKGVENDEGDEPDTDESPS